MTRIIRGTHGNLRRKIILKRAKGYKGLSSLLIRTAKQRVLKAEMNTYKDRQHKQKKWSQLWISRLNGVLRNYGSNWSSFKFLQKKAQFNLNKQILSQLSLLDIQGFQTYFLYLINTLCRI